MKNEGNADMGSKRIIWLLLGTLSCVVTGGVYLMPMASAQEAADTLTESPPAEGRAGERARLREPGRGGTELPSLAEILAESAAVHEDAQASDAAEHAGELRERASYLRPRLQARCDLELSEELQQSDLSRDRIREGCTEANRQLNDTLNSLPAFE